MVDFTLSEAQRELQLSVREFTEEVLAPRSIIAHEDFDPRRFMDDEFIEFTKSMESIDTVVAGCPDPVGAPA
jgi:hypothetical protein